MLEQHLTMILGPCAHPNCKLRAKFERSSSTDDVQQPKTFVKLWHSKEGCKACCNVMHEECFESVAEYMLERIRRHSTTISDRDIYKLMFVTTRNGKYDMIRKECLCACGGLFCVEVDAQGNPSLLGDPATSPSERKKKKQNSPKQTRSISIDLLKKKFEQEDVVEEGCEEYIWKEPTNKHFAEKKSAVAPSHYEYNDDTHPDLPFTACLPPPKKKNITRNVTAPMTIKVTSEKDFHVMTLPAESASLWKPSFIGYNGRNIKQLERYNHCSISVQDYYGGVRIFVRGHTSDREACCKVAEQRIHKAISTHSSS